MKRKIGLTATLMPKNWIRALYIIWKRKLRKIDHNLLIAFVAVVILILQMFIIVTAVSGQGKPKGLQIGDTRLNDTVGQARLDGLQIGQEMPDVTVGNIINSPAPSVKISDYKGKLLILDFWASWCSACISTLPMADSLQKQFAGKLEFLPITYQKEEEIKPFLAKLEKAHGILLRTAVNDKQLSPLFPHRYYPHYVWIDGNGIIRAITEFQQVNAENIRKILDGNQTGIREKKDVMLAYDRTRPLFIDGNAGTGNAVKYRSIYTGYVPGLPGGTGFFRTDSTVRLTARNSTLRSLFSLAYADKGIPLKRKIIVEVKDPAKMSSDKIGGEYLDWLKDNGHTYELLLPLSLQKQAYDMMRIDLERLLPQYAATIEKRPSKYIALVRTSDEDKLKSRGGKSDTRFDPFGFTLQNFPLQRLIDQLNVVYMQHSDVPVVNETGYTEWVDMEVGATMSDVIALNTALKKYDLEFIEKERVMERLVIRDKLENH
ncbi:MAG TPA: TlpA disulfide reductase family protein [Sphingobacteriaceae bacterium]